MKRLPYLDIAKGLAILAVMFGHQRGLSFSFQSFLFSWHLPVFFLIAGYTFKPKTMKEIVSISFKRLIIPYLFVSFYFLIHKILTAGFEAVPQKLLAILWASGGYHPFVLYWGHMPLVGSIWFLPAIFWTRVAYNWIAQYRYKYVIAIIVAIIATVIGNNIIALPTGICEGLSAMMFYSIGDSLKEYGHVYSNYKKVLIPLGAICACLFISFSMLSMCRCWYRNYPLDIVAACFMSWLAVLLSRQIEKQHYLNTIVQWIGINSLIFLCIHNMETYSIDYVKWFHLPHVWYATFPAKVIVCMIGTYLLGKIRFTRQIFAIRGIKSII